MRRSRHRRALAAFVAVATSGCAAVSKEAVFSDVQKALAERVDQRVEWNSDAAADATLADAVRELLKQDLTADAAVQIALLNDRNLQATFEELGIARADVIQAGLLRNPVFIIERRFTGQAAEVDLLQDFIALLSMPLRKRVAGAALEAAKMRVAEAVLDLAAEVRATFYTLQGAEQLVTMRRQVVEATEASADLSQQLRNAGNMTDLNLRMEQRLASQARLDLATAEEEVIQQRERLDTLLGLWGADTTWSIAARLPDLPPNEASLQGLESVAIAQRLDLAAARQDVVTAAEALGLTRTLRWLPAAAAGFHFEREPDGFSSIGPSLELVLPVFDWGQATVPRDRALLQQKQQRYIGLAVEIRSRVRATYSRMRSARARAEFYRRTELPLQTAILEQAQLQYNAMILGPLQLFQLKQAEIDTGRAYIEVQRDYWVARAELEHTLGGRMSAGDVAPAAPPSKLPGREQGVGQAQQQHHEEVEP